MSFNQILKGTLLPKVPLVTLFEQDTSIEAQKNVDYKSPTIAPSSAQKTGAIEPFIKIGGQIVSGIETMTIDETGFLPTISLTFIDELGEFSGDYFPKTNLIMNVYLKSASDKFKPIRCDFLITSVKSVPFNLNGKNNRVRYGVGMGTTYYIKGELHIPNIYNHVSKSYANLNSKDALKKICEEYGLGFVENESSPSDKMTWINTNTSALQFIKDIISHAYQSDDSFFMGYIDKYYYLNFIEVNLQLKAEDAQETFINMVNAMGMEVTQAQKDPGEKEEIENKTMVNYLTTELNSKSMPNYITKLNLISNQGEIIKKQGYKKNIFYYDHLKSIKDPKQKFTDFYMKPLRSVDRDQEQYLVPTEESLANNTVKKWMNIDYGNTHIHWNASRLLNTHNLKELEKMQLQVYLNSINFQVVRGSTIPVYVAVQQAEQVFKATTAPEDGNPESGVPPTDQMAKETPDLQLSGYYYVSGAKYHYDKLKNPGLTTELILSRREWAPSKKST